MGDDQKENEAVVVSSISNSSEPPALDVDKKTVFLSEPTPIEANEPIPSDPEVEKPKATSEEADSRKRAYSTDNEEDAKKPKLDTITLSSDDEADKEGSTDDSAVRTPQSTRKRVSVKSRTTTTPKGTPKASKEERERERQRRLEEKQKQKEERERIAEEKRLERERIQREKEEKRKEEERKKEEKRREEEEKKRQREEERERKRIEEEEKRKQREEEKERKRLEEEEKRKKKEEEKERKRKEEEEKLAKKREEDEKREQKRKEEEAEKEAEEAKKRRESNRFLSFFKVEKKPAEKMVEKKEKVETWYLPFEVKDGMTLAPVLHRDPVPTHVDILQQQGSSDYLHSIHNRRLIGVTNNSSRAKLFQFHDNYRPPYWGTWRKRPQHISGRRPLGKEPVLDYEVDSDLEWEEEPSDAEECRSDEEDNGDDAEDDDDKDGFFVEPGYLSDGEGECEEGDEGTERQPAVGKSEDVVEGEEGGRAERLAARAKIWEEDVIKKKKIKVLMPVVTGVSFHTPPPPVEGLQYIEFRCQFPVEGLDRNAPKLGTGDWLLGVAASAARSGVRRLLVGWLGPVAKRCLHIFKMRQHSLSSVRKLNELVHECNVQLAAFRHAVQGIGTSSDGASLRREVETAGRACYRACEAAKNCVLPQLRHEGVEFTRHASQFIGCVAAFVVEMKRCMALEKTFPAPVEPSVTTQQIANMENMLETLENLITVHFSTSESSPTDKVTPRRRRATSCRPQCVCSKLKTSYA